MLAETSLSSWQQDFSLRETFVLSLRKQILVNCGNLGNGRESFREADHVAADCSADMVVLCSPNYQQSKHIFSTLENEPLPCSVDKRFVHGCRGVGRYFSVVRSAT